MFTPNFEEGYALFKEKRYAEALSHFRLRKTSKGKYNHLAYLGYCHQHGLGVPQDLYTVKLWYERAMEYGGDIVVGSWIEMEYKKLKDMNLTPKDLSYVEFEDYVCGRIIMKIDKKYSLGLHFKDDRIEFFNDDCSDYRWHKEEPYDNIVNFIYCEHKKREEKRKEGSELEYHKMQGDVIPSILDETLRRDYNHFHLRVERGVGNKYTYRKVGDSYTVIVPKDAKFEQVVTREAIIRHGMKMMVMAAEEYLPKKLAEWSAKTGLQYKTCKISQRHKRYGCYSSDQSIELSCHLLKYDDIFIDRVIVHELCHSLYLNHNNEFYYAVLKYGGGELYDLEFRDYDPIVPYDI